MTGDRPLAWRAWLLACLMVGALVFGTSPNAAAQLDCETGSFDIATAAELNEAIDCFNRVGDVSVTLLNDIDASSLTGTDVFTEFARTGQSEFFVDGAGFTIARQAPGVPAPLFSVAAAADVQLVIVETNLELGLLDTAAIKSDGPIGLRMWASSVTAANGSLATAIDLPNPSADVTITETYIAGAAVGVYAGPPALTIQNSTIASTQTDVRQPLLGGFVIVNNSTLTAPVGIEFGRGSALVNGSTIVGDGAKPVDPAQGSVAFRSSIVGSCTAPLATGPGPDAAHADAGGNVGGCFGDDAVGLMPLADNACFRDPASLCTPTMALFSTSPAIGAGLCIGEGNFDDLTDDQRGLPRSPVGDGCDAGAFEFEGFDPGSIVCERGGPQVWTASSILELNQAVRCFNEGTAGAGDYTIALDADVHIAMPYEGFPVIVAIDQPGGDFALTIDAAGNELTLGDPLAITSEPVIRAPLTIAPTNQASLTLRDLQVTTESVLDVMIGHLGSGDLVLERVGLGNLGRLEVGIASDASAAVVIADSHVVAGVPVEVAGADLRISSSTLEALSTVAIFAQGPSRLDITNSTLLGDGALLADGEVSGTITNSTLAGGAGLTSAASMVEVRSSIATSCSGSLTDGGANAGGCFGTDPILLPAAADNGCVAANPSGCAPTVAIDGLSSARGVGDCTGVDVDQRGVPRSPVGPACDAGAFELELEIGDVDDDGDVDTADVQELLDWLAGGEQPPGLAVADLNGDAFVQLDDALALAQQIAG